MRGNEEFLATAVGEPDPVRQIISGAIGCLAPGVGGAAALGLFLAFPYVVNEAGWGFGALFVALIVCLYSLGGVLLGRDSPKMRKTGVILVLIPALTGLLVLGFVVMQLILDPVLLDRVMSV
jgi:tetrahydromethanopterin S-methyltransferase subunit D